MPVNLALKCYEAWLDPSAQEPERLHPLLRPHPAEKMTAYPVSLRVNNPRTDSFECMAPFVS